MSNQTTTVLIVDDDAISRFLLQTALERSYTLVFASNGEEAIDAVRRHRPTMVLLDIGLPDIDGYALCKTLRRIDVTQRLQVMFVTGYTDIQHEEAGFEAGGVDYLTKPISPSLVRARVSAHLSHVRVSVLEQSYRDAILMLGRAGHYNDNDTGNHIWRMGAYARLLAEGCGWDSDRSELLELAAPMHDTGKIGVPRAILQKNGPLTDEEWAIIKTHPQIGHDILSESSAPVFQLAAQIALHHHERWDGSGYPHGLRGAAIPESARLVTLADVFDALSMPRAYKKAWSVDEIVRHIDQGSGSHFDPDLVKVFHARLPLLLEAQQRWAQIEQPFGVKMAPPSSPSSI